MKVVSLFSGIGGFDLGFERAGMEIVGMCEIDKHAQKVLQRRFPGAVLHTDVREVHYERGSVDIICGGFPCQDLSTAGKRMGLAGERSGLWYEFARIIDQSEPKWIVIENVPGLLSSHGGADFAIIIRWLAQRGYGVGWRVLDAQGFGLAQRRKRVFIVASFGSPRGCTVLLETKHMQGNPKKNDREKKVYSSFVEQGVACTDGWVGVQNVSPTLVKNYSFPVYGFGDIRNPLAINSDLKVRNLTPVECERLQGFPDGWTDGQSDVHRYQQLGNAVAVPVAEWIGKRIMEVN
jgi:DNA (cytosine-5)-methyltransferase 1